MLYTKHKIINLSEVESNEELEEELDELSKDGWEVLGMNNAYVLLGMDSDDTDE